MIPLKGAIIGFGNIAVNGHLPAYRKNSAFEITAVMDVMPMAEERCLSILPDAAFYTSLDQLLTRHEVDFVDIATPPGTHASNIYRALEHGVHVLCEKPMVLNSSDYARIADMKKNTECVVYTVHNWRYSSIFQEVTRLMKNRAVGKIKKIDYKVMRTRPSIAAGESDVLDNWRLNPDMAGGGILVDHGWHAFYMLNQWMNNEPQWVECQLENRKFMDIPLEDTATALVGYESSEATLFFTWSGDERKNTVTIEGEKGSLVVDDDMIIVDNHEGRQEIMFDQALSQGSHHPDWYGAVMADFAAEITDADQAGRNFIEAGWCQHMMEMCTLSSSEGRRKILSSPQVTGMMRT